MIDGEAPRIEWSDEVTQEEMDAAERAEDFVNLGARIYNRMNLAHEREAHSIAEWLEKARRLLEAGYPEFAVVSGWIALEVLVDKVILSGFLLGMAWPFEEMVEWMRDDLLGRNGRIEKVRNLLVKSTMIDRIDKALWERLRVEQKRRNEIIHGGMTVDAEHARRAIETIQAVVDNFAAAIH